MPNEPIDPGHGSVPGPARSPGMSSPVTRIRSIRRPPLTAGVYTISAICGMLDAATFLGLGLVFVETMTGNILLLAFSVGTRGVPQFRSLFAGDALLPYPSALAAFA